MNKAFLAIVLLVLLAPLDLPFAQEVPKGVKIYSGYLFQHGAKKTSLCTIEFHSPVSFSHESVAVIPEELTYFIKFKNDPAFGKFLIKVFTGYDEEYTIDPDSEGKQAGINDEHHIFDQYLIYVILGSDITHLELISPVNNQAKYVLDKLEIHD